MIGIDITYRALYDECRLCPRDCRVDRSVRRGVCGEADTLRVAYVGPHFGEEPPISGESGSGTVFFTGCAVRCSFCQNHQISRGGLGEALTAEDLAGRIIDMAVRHRVHNINFVTPDHFFPDVFEVVSICRDRRGVRLPLVYNLSGYQQIESLQQAEPFADVYLPDFKYSDSELARKLSRCPDYPGKALDAVAEMIRQKGFLDSFETDGAPAGKGVLVRHLILPGEVENSMDALTMLFLEFGDRLPLSLMSQYHPVTPQAHAPLNRRLSKDEFDRVFDHALALGFRNLFVQFPEEVPAGGEGFSWRPLVPDFTAEEPFAPILG
ncbi:radical SAM protein [Desulfatiglans anilini]|uniref:radical SAM protein n=1 Tax=Desulfatiglans anilini TaxID=90728 RepID=UPI0003FCD66D|nr:radical SAM protein [Desulfatiglans anilini]